MKYDITSFQERYNRWKNGENYWNIIDSPLPQYKGGKQQYDTIADFITRFEGFSPTVYKNKGDVPTIGYGTTDSAYIKLGRITKEQGKHAVKQYLNKQDTRLRSIIPRWDDLPDSSKDALRSYNYNYYITPKNSPKLINALRVGDYDEAARQMNAGWNQDRVSSGLRKRRMAEKQMFLSGLRSKNPIKPLNYIQNINKNEQKVNQMIGLTKDGNYIAPSESPIYTPIQSNNLKGSQLYRQNPVQTTPLERVVINTNRSMFQLPDITDVIERIQNDQPIIQIPTL